MTPKCAICGKEITKGGFIIPRDTELPISILNFQYICSKQCLDKALGQASKRIGPSETKGGYDGEEATEEAGRPA